MNLFKRNKKTIEENDTFIATYPLSFEESKNISSWFKQFSNEKSQKPNDVKDIPFTLGETEMFKSDSTKKLKQIRINDIAVANQWVNPNLAMNSGNSQIQKTAFINKYVNFWECAATANDPIFVRLFRLLTEQTLHEGYELFERGSDTPNDEVKKEIEKAYDLESVQREAMELSFSVGGCLVYLDTEESDPERLAKPMTEAEYKAIKRFTPISPLMLGAREVNSTDPTRENYMRPEKWFVAGKGEIHSSRFVYFSHNEPVKTLLPLSMYFGIPYTQSLVQDVANIHSISQNLAQLVARFRERYIKVNRRNFNTTSARKDFADRMKTMVMYGNNFSLHPILDDEDVVQLISPINGLENFIQSEALVLCLETGLSMTKLLGVQSKGFGNRNEGDQNNFIETIIGTQKQFEGACSNLFSVAAKSLGYENIVMKFNKPKKIILDRVQVDEDKDVEVKDEKDS